jgi:adenylate kinase
MNIILFGPPGSGKGTQSALLSEKYNLKHISTGDILRSEMEKGSELGISAKKYVSEGKLVPDDIIINMLMNEIKNSEKLQKGVLLDGFPRTVAQAKALEDNLALQNKKTDVFIELNVNHNELIKRLLLRGEISGRMDDNKETILKRIQVYSEQTLPVKTFYQQLNKYVSVQGIGDINTIFKNICTEIDKHIKS